MLGGQLNLNKAGQKMALRYASDAERIKNVQRGPEFVTDRNSPVGSRSPNAVARMAPHTVQLVANQGGTSPRGSPMISPAGSPMRGVVAGGNFITPNIDARITDMIGAPGSANGSAARLIADSPANNTRSKSNLKHHDVHDLLLERHTTPRKGKTPGKNMPIRKSAKGKEPADHTDGTPKTPGRVNLQHRFREVAQAHVPPSAEEVASVQDTPFTSAMIDVFSGMGVRSTVKMNDGPAEPQTPCRPRSVPAAPGMRFHPGLPPSGRRSSSSLQVPGTPGRSSASGLGRALFASTPGRQSRQSLPLPPGPNPTPRSNLADSFSTMGLRTPGPYVLSRDAQSTPSRERRPVDDASSPFTTAAEESLLESSIFTPSGRRMAHRRAANFVPETPSRGQTSMARTREMAQNNTLITIGAEDPSARPPSGRHSSRRTPGSNRRLFSGTSPARFSLPGLPASQMTPRAGSSSTVITETSNPFDLATVPTSPGFTFTAPEGGNTSTPPHAEPSELIPPPTPRAPRSTPFKRSTSPSPRPATGRVRDFINPTGSSSSSINPTGSSSSINPTGSSSSSFSSRPVADPANPFTVDRPLAIPRSIRRGPHSAPQPTAPRRSSTQTTPSFGVVGGTRKRARQEDEEGTPKKSDAKRITKKDMRRCEPMRKSWEFDIPDSDDDDISGPPSRRSSSARPSASAFNMRVMSVTSVPSPVLDDGYHYKSKGKMAALLPLVDLEDIDKENTDKITLNDGRIKRPCKRAPLGNLPIPIPLRDDPNIMQKGKGKATEIDTTKQKSGLITTPTKPKGVVATPSKRRHSLSYPLAFGSTSPRFGYYKPQDPSPLRNELTSSVKVPRPVPGTPSKVKSIPSTPTKPRETPTKKHIENTSSPSPAMTRTTSTSLKHPRSTPTTPQKPSTSRGSGNSKNDRTPTRSPFTKRVKNILSPTTSPSKSPQQEKPWR